MHNQEVTSGSASGIEGPAQGRHEIERPEMAHKVEGPAIGHEIERPGMARRFEGPALGHEIERPGMARRFEGPTQGQVIERPGNGRKSDFIQSLRTDDVYEELEESASSTKRGPDDAEFMDRAKRARTSAEQENQTSDDSFMYMGNETTFDPSASIESFFKSTDKSEYAAKLRKAIVSWQNMVPAQASEEMLAYLDTEGKWGSHDKKIDFIWDQYVERLAKICGCYPHDFVKPSGPLKATIAFVWHFPTSEYCARAEYGHVFDPKNPCLYAQKKKIGSSNKVLTIDMYPRRMSPKDFDAAQKEPWWVEYQSVCQELLAELTQYSKIVVVMGRANNLQLVPFFANNSMKVKKVDIFVEDNNQNLVKAKMFGEDAVMHIVDKHSEIKQIFLPSYHGEWLRFHSRDKTADRIGSRMCDMLWEFAASVAGLTEVNTGYFQWNCVVNGNRARDWKFPEGIPVHQKIRILSAWEKKNPSESVPQSLLKDLSGDWVSNPQNAQFFKPEWVPPYTATQINWANCEKARSVQAAKGYPALAQGRITYRADNDKKNQRKLAVLRTSTLLSDWRKGTSREKSNATAFDKLMAAGAPTEGARKFFFRYLEGGSRTIGGLFKSKKSTQHVFDLDDYEE